MATATRRRRRTKSAPARIGKEAWQVIDNAKGVVVAQRDGKTHTDGAVLNHAQGLAERKYTDEVELLVMLVPLFGDPDIHYRVVREEDGSISTYRVLA